MNITYCTVDASPYVKKGDVSELMGCVPKTVVESGHKVNVILPKYSKLIPTTHLARMKYLTHLFVDIKWRKQYCGVYKISEGGITYYFLDNEFYFGEGGYAIDEFEKFAFFSRSCLQLLATIEKQDIINCGGVYGALLPVYLEQDFKHYPRFAHAHVVYTLNNLAQQGEVEEFHARDILALRDTYFTENYLMHNGKVNIVKGALACADYVTAVSSGYAKELTTEPFGHGLSEFIKTIKGKFKGILNGIEGDVYNPAKDKGIAQSYNKLTFAEGKARNKLQVQLLTRLPLLAETPLFCVISPLSVANGTQLLIDSMWEILSLGVQMIVVGDGDPHHKDQLKALMKRYPNHLFFTTTNDLSITKQLYAGCDAILVPDLIKPSGANILKAFRYGAVPIAYLTGGVRDTVIDSRSDAVHGNGFIYTEPTTEALVETIRQAKDLYQNETFRNKVISNCMKVNYRWKHSVALYLKLYAKLSNKKAVVVPRSKKTAGRKASTNQKTTYQKVEKTFL